MRPMSAPVPPPSSRLALISGANRGLGLETARQLLELGYSVLLTSRDPAHGEQAAHALGRPGQVFYHPLDVTQPGSVARLRVYVQAEFSHLDALINNAAVFLDDEQSILSIPEQVFQQTLETNTLGPLRLCQAFLPLMLAQNYGRVVNVSSGMGQIDDLDDYGAAYRISKLALNGVTRILAHAARGKNVLINAVCPGWVRTDMGGPNASRGLQEGARGIVWAATLPDGGPQGGFFRDGKPVPW
jgi:NAD(P)-dependent dehydrogenase (short-subunit alcohol dehydrogenase family)